MIDIQELRELAQKATQGNWESSNDGFVSMRRMRNDVRYVVGIAQCDHRAEDADFIAAANPAAILELLDRLEAAETEQHRLSECLRLANSNAEYFERQWYLRGDALEAAERDAANLRNAVEDAAEEWARYVEVDYAPTSLVPHMLTAFDHAMQQDDAK